MAPARHDGPRPLQLCRGLQQSVRPAEHPRKQFPEWVQHQPPSPGMLHARSRSWTSRGMVRLEPGRLPRHSRNAHRPWQGPPPCSGTAYRCRTDHRGRRSAQPVRAPEGAARQPRRHSISKSHSCLYLNRTANLSIPSTVTLEPRVPISWKGCGRLFGVPHLDEGGSPCSENPPSGRYSSW